MLPSNIKENDSTKIIFIQQTNATNQSVTCLRTQFQNPCSCSLNGLDGNLSTLFPQPNSARPSAGNEGKTLRVYIITRKKHCNLFAAFYLILLVLKFSILNLCMLSSVCLQQKHLGGISVFLQMFFSLLPHQSFF